MKLEKPLHGCTFGILGDSYSTFEGYIPAGQDCYYPNPNNVSDVLRVEDTWWHILMRQNHMKLLLNDSYSGATVCTRVRETQPKAAAFTERAKKSFSGDLRPDFIFLFGCTNDNWLERPVGKLQYDNWTEEDLAQVLPAYCFVLHQLTGANPDAVVVSVLNTGLRPDIHAGMARAGEYYGAVTVELTRIDKQNGHPSALGMQQIARQIQAALQ